MVNINGVVKTRLDTLVHNTHIHTHININMLCGKCVTIKQTKLYLMLKNRNKIRQTHHFHIRSIKREPLMKLFTRIQMLATVFEGKDIGRYTIHYPTNSTIKT